MPRRAPAATTALAAMNSKGGLARNLRYPSNVTRRDEAWKPSKAMKNRTAELFSVSRARRRKNRSRHGSHRRERRSPRIARVSPSGLSATHVDPANKLKVGVHAIGDRASIHSSCLVERPAQFDLVSREEHHPPDRVAEGVATPRPRPGRCPVICFRLRPTGERLHHRITAEPELSKVWLMVQVGIPCRVVERGECARGVRLLQSYLLAPPRRLLGIRIRPRPASSVPSEVELRVDQARVSCRPWGLLKTASPRSNSLDGLSPWSGASRRLDEDAPAAEGRASARP